MLGCEYDNDPLAYERLLGLTEWSANQRATPWLTEPGTVEPCGTLLGQMIEEGVESCGLEWSHLYRPQVGRALAVAFGVAFEDVAVPQYHDIGWQYGRREGVVDWTVKSGQNISTLLADFWYLESNHSFSATLLLAINALSGVSLQLPLTRCPLVAPMHPSHHVKACCDCPQVAVPNISTFDIREEVLGDYEPPSLRGSRSDLRPRIETIRHDVAYHVYSSADRDSTAFYGNVIVLLPDRLQLGTSLYLADMPLDPVYEVESDVDLDNMVRLQTLFAALDSVVANRLLKYQKGKSPEIRAFFLKKNA